MCEMGTRHQNTDGEPETDDTAKSNVARFLSAHIIPVSLLNLYLQLPAPSLVSPLSSLLLNPRLSTAFSTYIPLDSQTR